MQTLHHNQLSFNTPKQNNYQPNYLPILENMSNPGGYTYPSAQQQPDVPQFRYVAPGFENAVPQSYAEQIDGAVAYPQLQQMTQEQELMMQYSSTEAGLVGSAATTKKTPVSALFISGLVFNIIGLVLLVVRPLLLVIIHHYFLRMLFSIGTVLGAIVAVIGCMLLMSAYLVAKHAPPSPSQEKEVKKTLTTWIVFLALTIVFLLATVTFNILLRLMTGGRIIR
jgi:hypothetical protein